MEAGDVITLLKLLEEEKIGVVVDGGWGVDALLGRQSRPHEDLDIAIEHKDVPKLRKPFEGKGYKEVPQPESSDFNFVLGNTLGQKVDVHSYTFDAYAKNVYGISYPAESLTGAGSIEGHAVRCISALNIFQIDFVRFVLRVESHNPFSSARSSV